MGWFERGAVLLGRAHERSEASLRGRLRGLIFEQMSHAKKLRRKGDRVGVCCGLKLRAQRKGIARTIARSTGQETRTTIGPTPR